MALPRSLAEELRGWPDDRIADLLRARPDLMAPVPPDFGALAARAAYPGSVARVLDGLPRPQLQVAEVICLLPGPASVAAVADLLDGGDPTPVLARLRGLALLWGEDDALSVVPSVRQLLPDPAGLGQPVEELLRLRPSAALALLSANLGLPPERDRGGAVAALTAVFTDDSRVDTLLDELDPAARAVLDRLAPGPPLGQVEDAARAVPLDAARTPVEQVLARGLLLPVDAGTVVLPREVGLRLRGGRAHPGWTADTPDLGLVRHDPRDVDRAGAGAAFALLRHLEELLEPWGLVPPAVLRSGGLGVRDLRRFAGDLGIDEHAVTLLLEAAGAAGLLARSPNGERWLPTEAYDTWRAQEPATRWATLVWAWLWTSRVPGVAGMRDRERLIAALGPDLDYPESVPVRLAVLAELATLPPGGGRDPEALADALDWEAPLRFGRLGRQLLTWTLREAEQLGVAASGALTSAARALLEAEAAAMPADRPARSWPEPPPAAASTARAAAAAVLAPLLPEPLDYVLIQADLTAVAPGPLTAELAGALALAADVESRGGATVYRFTPTSIRRALDAGRPASELHAWLTAISRTPVPQPLTYLVDDVARRHGRMRVGPASSYLRCEDETALTELLADRRTLELGLRRLAPTVLVSPLPPEKLLEALRGLGAAPALEGAGGELVLRRPDVLRAATPRRIVRLPADAPAPGETLLATAVRALRAGDRARSSVRPSGSLVVDGSGDAPVSLVPTAPSETLTILRTAARDGTGVWIGYVNAEGGGSVRLIEPIAVSGGFVSAYDHLREESRTFAVHRITGVAPARVEEDA